MATSSSLNPGGGGLHQEIQEAIDQVEQLKVTELKAICRSIELPITGRKAVLQDRIRAYLKNSCSIGHIDPWRPKTIRVLIDKAKLGEVLPKYDIMWQTLKTGAFNHPVATGAQPVSTLPLQQLPQRQRPSQGETGYTPYGTISPGELSVTGNRPAAPKNRYMHFKESPFYKMRKLIQETAQKLNITNVRGSCVARFRFTKSDWALLESYQKYRVYLFCGMVNAAGFQSNQPIQFPYPNEIKVNSVQIKDNVRGLKNKLGTAKPADLTPYLKAPTQQNMLEIVYAFTKSEYYIYCYIVEEVTPEELLQQILEHPKIIKAATLHYLEKTLNEEEDDDLVTTSTVMTLQCPISYTRMAYPVKSIMCKHLQCFDALWYMHSQRQIPTWECPVCQIDIDLNNLAICEFVDEILKNSGEDVEQVELSADGSWKPVVEEPPKQEERPAAIATTKVKLENGEDEDKPLSAYSRGPSLSNEPVVISLDSDQEDEPMEQEETATVRKLPRQESSLPAAPRRAYVDDHNNESQATLDPRVNQTTTPTAPRQNSWAAEDSLDYMMHSGVPNILGKTPLNNGDEDPPLAEGNSGSPTPNSHARGIFTPASTMSPTTNGQLSLQGARENGSSFRSHSGTLDPNASSNEGGSRPSSMLGMTGQITCPPNPSTASTASAGSNGNGSNLLGISGELSSLRTAPEDRPPPLPPLPHPGPRPPSRQPVPMRTRKPVVSPFMPVKPYLNMLPRKRHISNSPTGVNCASGANGVNGINSPQALGVSMDNPAAHSSSSHSDDVVDLTSD